MIVFRDTGRPLVCTPIILTSFPVARAVFDSSYTETCNHANILFIQHIG